MIKDIFKESIWFHHYGVYLIFFFIFVTFRLCQYFLIWLSPSNQFDTSTIIFLKKVTPEKDLSLYKIQNEHLWNKLLSWDSIFFIKGIVSELLEYPEFDFELVFSRIWVGLITSLLKLMNISVTEENFYFILKFTIFVENILHFLSVIIVYHLTILIYTEITTIKNHTTIYAKKVAILSSILFIFTSGSGFFISIYSEPLSFFLTFLGLWFRELCFVKDQKSAKESVVKFKNGLFPLICYLGTIPTFTLATLNRPNCVLLGLIYIYDLFCLLKRLTIKKQLNHNLTTTVKQIIIFPLISGSIMLLVVVYYWFYIPFKKLCPSGGEWCDRQIIKKIPFITRQSFYSFIQAKYWNVGFLKYWTFSNIPNFLIAMPQFIIYLKAIHHFITNTNNCRNGRNTVIPLVAITIMFLLIILFLAHVQIINRVSSFIPLHLWYLSESLISAKTNNQILYHKKEHGTSTKNNNFDDTNIILVKMYFGWLFFWIFIQTILFGLFLPPA